VVEVLGKRIRLGICAPPSVRVDRKEVHERQSLEWSTEICAPECGETP
jgi:sRNA-binding carbon storage regulator CsrA